VRQVLSVFQQRLQLTPVGYLKQLVAPADVLVAYPDLRDRPLARLFTQLGAGVAVSVNADFPVRDLLGVQ
tara:strand:- start:168 stop:377 length:210 start_codon:yes stop_codon:yes gene_type:complete